MNEVFCPNCGNKLLAEEKFCSRCGNARPAPGSQQTGSNQSQTVYQAPIQPPYQSSAGPTARKTPAYSVALFVISCVLLVGAIAFGAWKLWLNKPVLNPNNTFLAVNNTEPAKTVTPATTPVSTVLSTPPAKITAPPATQALVTTAPQATIADATSEQILQYFLEIGVDQYDGHIKRWEKPIKVEIKGDYSDEDYERVVTQLDLLNDFGTIPDITVVKSGGNFFIHFAPKSKMSTIIQGYDGKSNSYYNYYWNNYQLTKFVTVINSGLAQKERNSYALEMIIRGLGFFNKSSKYTDSVFHEYNHNIQQLSDMDYYLIGVMYSDMIKSGMDEAAAQNSLAG